MPKKHRSYKPETQYKKLIQQYESIFLNLEQCKSAQAMRKLLKTHDKRIKRIGQDNLDEQHLYIIAQFEQLLQQRKRTKEEGFGLQRSVPTLTSTVSTSSSLDATISGSDDAELLPQSPPVITLAEAEKKAKIEAKTIENTQATSLKVTPIEIENASTVRVEPQQKDSVEKAQKPERANYEQLLAWLETQGPVGYTLSQALVRLHQGANNNWNPYWMNSREKQDKIITALNRLAPQASVAAELQDKTSELYLAVNMQRITRFTLFGSCAINQSKSLQAVEAAYSVSQP